LPSGRHVSGEPPPVGDLGDLADDPQDEHDDVPRRREQEDGEEDGDGEDHEPGPAYPDGALDMMAP
jgi:hypothetical protein